MIVGLRWSHKRVCYGYQLEREVDFVFVRGMFTSINLSVSLSSHCSYLFTAEALATKVALLKRNCFASVFEKYFELQAKGGEKGTAIIHYRDQETM